MSITPDKDRFGDDRPRRLRRVVIEERQRNVLEHVRDSLGYAEDLDPHAHDRTTFRLINQRKRLDELPGSEVVMPALDQWKHWSKMNDWDSRNALLEDLIGKLRRREASEAEICLLIAICRPTWASIARSLHRYGGVEVDPRAAGKHRREEAHRANELDYAELNQVVQHGLLDALIACPRPFPHRFFPWLKAALAHRALDHVRQDICEHGTVLPDDVGIQQVVEAVLSEARLQGSSALLPRVRDVQSQWLRTLDLPGIFVVAEEYASYTQTESACRRAVDRLPTRQREVIQSHYYDAMTQTQIARLQGVADSTVRNTHAGALRNLRRDDELFDVLEAVGKVRDRARRIRLQSEAKVAA